ncbi:MAG: hypothetical protein HYY04_01270 [Chloroflexi bacterium]|nr:hypothetical protein [Chloroflexota bacterium]
MLRRAVSLIGASLLIVVVAATANVLGVYGLLGRPSLSGAVYAQTLAVSGTFSSSFAVQNRASTDANVRVRFIQENGNELSPQDEIVRANKAKTFLPGWPSAGIPDASVVNMVVTDGFRGSVVIESDQPVVVTANINTSDYSVADMYSGVSEPATLLYLPLVQHFNGPPRESTKIYIQNTLSTSLPATGDPPVTVTFYDGRTQAQTVQVTLPAIPGLSSVAIDQSTESVTYPTGATVTGSFPSTWFGSAVVNSPSGNVAAIVQNAGTDFSQGTQFLGSYTGSTASNAGNVLYAPLVQNENDRGTWWSGIKVMNAGSSTVDIVAEVAGRIISRKSGIPQYGAGTWLTPLPSDGFVVSAGVPVSDVGKTPSVRFRAVTPGTETTASGALLVGLVQQFRRYDSVSGTPYSASAYRLFPSTAGRSTVFAPNVDYRNDSLSVPLSQRWWTGIQAMNIGGQRANLQLYVNGAICGTPRGVDSLAGTVWFTEAHLCVSNNLDGSGRYIASAWILATNDDSTPGSIVAIVNRQRFQPGKENILAYEAFGQ